jgi:hypothetical protein
MRKAMLLMLLGFSLAELASARDASFTGCLTSRGTLVKVAIGGAPFQPCLPTETRVSWNAQGPEGPAGLDGVDGVGLPPACFHGDEARWDDDSQAWACSDVLTRTAGSAKTYAGSAFAASIDPEGEAWAPNFQGYGSWCRARIDPESTGQRWSR